MGRMKVSVREYEALKERLGPLDTEEARQAYRDGRFPRAELVHDLNKRYRWDLFYFAEGYKCLDEGYSGNYNGDHIYTALRHIIPNL